MRPIDLARGLGLSTQAVRNYEAAGILPPAQRTQTGYRVYTPLHAQALETFAALVPAHGHATAAAIMRAANDGAVDDVLRLLDESHAQLFEDRMTLAAVTEALHRLAPPPRAEASAPRATAEAPAPRATAEAPAPRATAEAPAARAAAEAPAATGKAEATFVGPLAHQLGLRPATLRKWERAGLISPSRDRRTGYRVYTPDNVRDARLAHQLRRGGYPLKKIGVLLEQVRAAGGVEPLAAALGQWRDRLTGQGHAMLAGAAALHSYLAARALPQGSQNLPDERVARDRKLTL